MEQSQPDEERRYEMEKGTAPSIFGQCLHSPAPHQQRGSSISFTDTLFNLAPGH